MAGRGKEAGFGVVGGFGLFLGVRKFGVQNFKRVGTFGHAGFKPLVGFLKSLFGGLAFGDVVIDAEIAKNFAGFVKMRDIGAFGIAAFAHALHAAFIIAVARDCREFDFKALAIALKHQLDHRGQMDIAFLAHRFADRHAVGLNTPKAKHPLIRAVGKAQALIFIGIGDHHRNVVGVNPDIAFAFAKGFFGAYACRDVSNGGNKTAIGHRVGTDFKHHAIGTFAFIGVRKPAHLGGCIAAQKDIDINRTGFVGTANLHQLGQWQGNLNVACRDAKQINEPMVPGRQTQVLIKHADPLGNVFKGIEQQITVEFDRLGRFVEKFHRVTARHRLIGQQKRHHHAR